jgi:hypothetical protein
MDPVLGEAAIRAMFALLCGDGVSAAGTVVPSMLHGRWLLSEAVQLHLAILRPRCDPPAFEGLVCSCISIPATGQRLTPTMSQ